MASAVGNPTNGTPAALVARHATSTSMATGTPLVITS